MDQQQSVQAPSRGNRQFKWPPPHTMLSTQQPQSLEHQAPDLPYSVPEELRWLDIPSLQTAPLPKQQKRKSERQKQGKPRRKRLRRMFIITSLITILSLILFSQSNGQVGAVTADIMRAVLGPTITAQIESWFLGVADTAHQIQYNLGGHQVSAPWTVASSQEVAPSPIPQGPTPMPLVSIKPFISPPLPGEGVWTTNGLPSPPSHIPSLVAKAFIRPDPARPYAIVTLLQFDTRFVQLHMVAGTAEPGGARGVAGPGVIPSSDLKNNQLLAAFNGGFKYADGQYGMMVNGTVYVPAQNGAATIAVTRQGQLILGAWGVDPRLNSRNTDLLAWRQNASLLIDHGTVSSLANDGAAWGGTVLNQAYTWRSGIGITSSGSLLYAAGDALSALTLGKALQAAGAVMAMQTDINPFWVRAFVYNHSASGSLQITRLNSGMQGTGYEYLYGNQRDFFYLTRVLPGSIG